MYRNCPDIELLGRSEHVGDQLGIEADSRSSADPDETPAKTAANRTGPDCGILRTEPDETPAQKLRTEPDWDWHLRAEAAKAILSLVGVNISVVFRYFGFAGTARPWWFSAI